MLKDSHIDLIDDMSSIVVHIATQYYLDVGALDVRIFQPRFYKRPHYN